MVNIIKADYLLPEHGAAIVRLMDEYARDPMGGGQGLSEHAKANLVAALAARSNARSVLAYIDTEAVGLVNCLEGFSTFACAPLLNVHDVMVSQAFRGQGIAPLMLAKVEEMARAMGCCKLTLEVLEGNLVAQRTYRAAGFKGYALDPEMGQALFWEKKLDSVDTIPSFTDAAGARLSAN
jgi:ribosomal protein S18 acetylase RimI-like enzyme